MMGQQAGSQNRLFYSFDLDDHVPPDHLLRRIDRVLDLSKLRGHLAEFCSHTGRPSIDPELMVRMLIVGYCFGICSERRLCEEVHLNLAYRWFCRLGLEDPVPEHSTFSKNRHGRFRDSGTFRWLFDEVVHSCMSAGLVKGEGFAVDASVVAADANRQRGVPGSEPVDWNEPARGTRAVREYLAALDGDPLVQTLPKNISLTDPQSRWTAAPAHRSSEVDATKRMVERVEERFNIKPERLIGDTAYGTAPMLAWMVEEKGIEPHVPVWDKTQREDDTLSSSDFEWNEQANEYRCPQGHALRSQWRTFANPRTHVTSADTIIYRSRQSDCANCPMKNRCCPNTPFRKITRSIHEAVPRTSSRWQRLPRTCEDWPSCCRKDHQVLVSVCLHEAISTDQPSNRALEPGRIAEQGEHRASTVTWPASIPEENPSSSTE